MDATPVRVDEKRRGLLAALAAFVYPATMVGQVRAQQRRDGHEPLTRIDDLRTLAAQVRRQQRPLLLFFSVPGCPFCLEVRRSHLGPLALDPDRGPLVREIVISSRRNFTGLDGRATSEYDFANVNNVRMVPHVVLVDAELKPLAEPMIGLGVSDFYGDYLASAIDAATKKLGGR